MAFYVDIAPGQNPHVNYEPSTMGGLTEATPTGDPYEPYYSAKLVKEPIDRQNNFKQAGETYRKFEAWERDELISNLVGALSTCSTVIREQMISNLTEADSEYGKRVAEGLKQADQHHKDAGHVGTDIANEGMELSAELGHSTDGY